MRVFSIKERNRIIYSIRFQFLSIFHASFSHILTLLLSFDIYHTLLILIYQSLLISIFEAVNATFHKASIFVIHFHNIYKVMMKSSRHDTLPKIRPNGQLYLFEKALLGRAENLSTLLHILKRISCVKKFLKRVFFFCLFFKLELEYS